VQEESKTPTKPKKKHQLSGFWAAKRAISKFGSNVLDGRSAIAKRIQELRTALVNDLGGEQAISRQQDIVIGNVLKEHLLLESLDAFIFSMHSPVNKRSRQLYPVVRERSVIADSLVKHLAMLGLERKLPPAKPLEQFLVEHEKKSRPPQEMPNAEVLTDTGSAIVEGTEETT